jgi:regulatory protein
MENRKPRRLAGDELWNHALKLLAGRAHSTGELRVKLQRRAENPDEIDDLLNRLKELGYLDDRRYAESFATARLSNDRLGSTRVIQDLRQRRVAPALAERSVAKVYSEVDEEQLIMEWIRRKYRQAPREGLFQEDKELASAFGRLRRAGFRTAQVIRVLKKFAKNPDLLDGVEEADEPQE